MNKHLIDVSDLTQEKLAGLWHWTDIARDDTTVCYKDSCAQVHAINRFRTQDDVFGLIFLEPSTRTRASFHLAARRLGMEPITFLPGEIKQDSLFDLVRVMVGLGAGVIAVRSPDTVLEATYAASHASIINAGDGADSHPTQALGDFAYLNNRFGGELEGKRFVVVGDVAHSRVANSEMALAKKCGMTVVIAAPPMWFPLTPNPNIDESYFNESDALRGADIVLTFRPQWERHSAQEKAFADSRNYLSDYQVTYRKMSHLANNGAIILHPGPRTGVEIDPVAYQRYCNPIAQVEWGTYVRTALIYLMVSGVWELP